MTQAKGFMSRMILDFETEFGKIPTSKAGKIYPVNTLELVSKQELIKPATIRGSRHQAPPARGRLSVEGSAQLPFDISAIGYIFKGLFGAPVTAAAGGSYNAAYKKHTFKPGSTQPSLVIEKGFTDINQYYIYNGCKLSTFKLPFGGEGELLATVEFMGANETLGTAPYTTTPQTPAFDRLNNFHATIKEAGQEIGIVSKGELNINMGLDGSQYTVGAGNNRGGIPEGIIAVSGVVTVLFSDSVLMDKVINGTPSSLELLYTLPGTTATDNKVLSIRIPELVFERTSPKISGPAGVSVDLNWQGFYNTNSESTSIKVELINAVDSY